MSEVRLDDWARCRRALFRAGGHRTAPIQVVWQVDDGPDIEWLAAQLRALAPGLDLVADIDDSQTPAPRVSQGLLAVASPVDRAEALIRGCARLVQKQPSIAIARAEGTLCVLTVCGVVNDRRTVASALGAINGEAADPSYGSVAIPTGPGAQAVQGIQLPTALPSRLQAEPPYKAEIATATCPLRSATTTVALVRAWGDALCRYTAEPASAFQITAPASDRGNPPSAPRVVAYRRGANSLVTVMGAAESARLYAQADRFPVPTAVIVRLQDFLDRLGIIVYESRPHALAVEYVAGTREIQATYDPAVFEQTIVETMLEKLATELDGRRSSTDHSAIRPLTKGLPIRKASPISIISSDREECAVITGEGTYSRSEINAWARNLGAILAPDAGGQSPVALTTGRSAEGLVAMLACRQSGRPFVPLDVSWPSTMREQVIQDSGCTQTLTVEDVRCCRPGASGDDRPLQVADSRRPAYVIYTSGTTGQAKGVVVSGEALGRYIESAGSHYPVDAGSVVLWSSSPAFDSTIVETLVAFERHADIVIPSAEELQSARAFWDLCERRNVSVLPISTALWHNVARPICAGEIPPPRGLKVVSFGGERASANLVSEWLRRAPGVRLLNGYGPTEAVVEALSASLNDVAECLRSASVPIGRPMPGRLAYLFRTETGPPDLCAFGEIGELYLGGILADGYLGDPTLTDERFVTNPFEPGVLYRTGDLASMWPDGLYYFHGRRDREEKVRGHRINLDYVEDLLCRAPGVAEAVVVARQGRVEAYVVLDTQSSSAERVMTWIERAVPRSMQPATVTVRDSLPLTPAGKVDRDALAADGQNASLAGVNGARAVHEAWAALLGQDVSPSSTVAKHGGDSLTAARIAAYLERQYGIELPIDIMYSYPTLMEQQEWVTEKLN